MFISESLEKKSEYHSGCNIFGGKKLQKRENKSKPKKITKSGKPHHLFMHQQH